MTKTDKIHLTVAIKPTSDLISAVKEWIDENVPGKVDFSLSMDPTILAGAQVDYKGKYLDASLEGRFDEYLQAKDGVFRKILI